MLLQPWIQRILSLQEWRLSLRWAAIHKSNSHALLLFLGSRYGVPVLVPPSLSLSFYYDNIVMIVDLFFLSLFLSL